MGGSLFIIPLQEKMTQYASASDRKTNFGKKKNRILETRRYGLGLVGTFSGDVRFFPEKREYLDRL